MKKWILKNIFCVDYERYVTLESKNKELQLRSEKAKKELKEYISFYDGVCHYDKNKFPELYNQFAEKVKSQDLVYRQKLEYLMSILFPEKEKKQFEKVRTENKKQIDESLKVNDK